MIPIPEGDDPRCQLCDHPAGPPAPDGCKHQCHECEPTPKWWLDAGVGPRLRQGRPASPATQRLAEAALDRLAQDLDGEQLLEPEDQVPVKAPSEETKARLRQSLADNPAWRED